MIGAMRPQPGLKVRADFLLDRRFDERVIDLDFLEMPPMAKRAFDADLRSMEYIGCVF